jgi:4'-phosphopantetheinyl transferase
MSQPVKINWPVPEEFPSLRRGEIHLWCAWLGPDGGEAATDTAGLSPDEAARARSLHFATDRHRFIVARLHLRRVLAGYVGRDPASLVFRYGRFGKPALSHQATVAGPLDAITVNLSFNQSHCGPLWLLAVARNQPLGVDLEAVRDLDDLQLVESVIFSPAELARQQALPPAARQEEFFRRWTRREAAAKFHGQGFEPSIEHAAEAIAPDRIEPIDPVEGYAAALAYSGVPARLRHFAWDPALLSDPAMDTVRNQSAPRLSAHRQPASTSLC